MKNLPVFTVVTGFMRCTLKISAIGQFLTVLIAAGPVSAQNDFSFAIGEAFEMSDPGVPNYTYSPEGHFSLLKEDDGTITVHWPGGDSYRMNGQSVKPETKGIRQRMIRW